jgi:threonine/homoserine efflux transporter RhtA
VRRRHWATVSVRITASRAASALVDVEIYAPTGRRIAQRAWPSVRLTGGVTRSLRWSWYASSTRMPGTYTVKVGVFRAGWAGLLAWNNRAALIRVTR